MNHLKLRLIYSIFLILAPTLPLVSELSLLLAPFLAFTAVFTSLSVLSLSSSDEDLSSSFLAPFSSFSFAFSRSISSLDAHRQKLHFLVSLVPAQW